MDRIPGWPDIRPGQKFGQILKCGQAGYWTWYPAGYRILSRPFLVIIHFQILSYFNNDKNHKKIWKYSFTCFSDVSQNTRATCIFITICPTMNTANLQEFYDKLFSWRKNWSRIQIILWIQAYIYRYIQISVPELYWSWNNGTVLFVHVSVYLDLMTNYYNNRSI